MGDPIQLLLYSLDLCTLNPSEGLLLMSFSWTGFSIYLVLEGDVDSF